MFSFLEKLRKKKITGKKKIAGIFNAEAFSEFGIINVMPLIYRETEKQCNILVFDHEKAKRVTAEIIKVSSGKGRKHPVYLFRNSDGKYICEVRYGSATANALQRGLWTHTKNALPYFDSLTNGWIDYSHNHTLVRLFHLALVASGEGHKNANIILQKDIDRIKKI